MPLNFTGRLYKPHRGHIGSNRPSSSAQQARSGYDPIGILMPSWTQRGKQARQQLNEMTGGGGGGSSVTGLADSWAQRRQQAEANVTASEGGGDDLDSPVEIPPPDPAGGGAVHPSWSADSTILQPDEWPKHPDGTPYSREEVRGAFTPAIPYYTDDDFYRPLRENWSESRIIRLQKQLERTGLLEPGTYRTGMWDPQSVQAFQQVILQSNAQATSWDETLQQLIANPIVEPLDLPELEEWTPPTYPRPNPENVGESVRTLITDLVGSEYATEERVNKFTQQFMADHRSAFETRSDFQRIQHEQEQRQMREQALSEWGGSTGDVTIFGGEEEELPEEVEIPDPEETLGRTVREDVQGIADAQENVAATQRSNQTLNKVFGSMLQWNRGGS